MEAFRLPIALGYSPIITFLSWLAAVMVLVLVAIGALSALSYVDMRSSALEDRAASAERELARLKSNPVRVEVPVIPPEIGEVMAELAARAEALADKAEEMLAEDVPGEDMPADDDDQPA